MKTKITTVLAYSILTLFLAGCDVEFETSTSSSVSWEASEGSGIAGSIEMLGEKEEYSLKMSNGHLFYNGIDYGPCKEGDRIEIKNSRVYINGTEVKQTDTTEKNE